eukprot:3524327-Prymnesium_polylepis.1
MGGMGGGGAQGAGGRPTSAESKRLKEKSSRPVRCDAENRGTDGTRRPLLCTRRPWLHPAGSPCAPGGAFVHLTEGCCVALRAVVGERRALGAHGGGLGAGCQGARARARVAAVAGARAARTTPHLTCRNLFAAW